MWTKTTYSFHVFTMNLFMIQVTTLQFLFLFLFFGESDIVNYPNIREGRSNLSEAGILPWLTDLVYSTTFYLVILFIQYICTKIHFPM